MQEGDRLVGGKDSSGDGKRALSPIGVAFQCLWLNRGGAGGDRLGAPKDRSGDGKRAFSPIVVA